jgi:hypothetical protein
MNRANPDQGIEYEALRLAEQKARKKREKKTFAQKVKELIGAK